MKMSLEMKEQFVAKFFTNLYKSILKRLRHLKETWLFENEMTFFEWMDWLEKRNVTKFFSKLYKSISKTL